MEFKFSNGSVGFIDEDDSHLLEEYRWSVARGLNTYYARSERIINGKRTMIQLHRLITRAKPGELVDHKNRNGLDNRKENLRICTNSQNQGNSEKQINNTSGFKGVSMDKNRWVAQIQFNGKRKKLGYFDKKEDAAKKYNEFALEYFGEFARLNDV